MGESAQDIPAQATQGCKLIKATTKKKFPNFIIPLDANIDFVSYQLYQTHQIYTTALTIVLVTEVLFVTSLPPLALCLVALIQILLSWLIGMVVCFPLIIIFSLIIFTGNKC